VRVYNTALSTSTIQQLYHLGTVNVAHSNTVALNSGLVGYWPLDGNTTNWTTDTTQDTSGNGNTGTMVNMSTTTSVVAGKIGSALKFNGTNQYIFTTNSSGISGAQPRTVSFWAKSSIATYSSNGYAFCLNTTSSGTNTLFALRVDSGSQTWKIALGGSTKDTSVAVTTNWVNVVATFDANQNLNVYVNGKITSVVAVNFPSLNTTAGQIIIGAQENSGSFAGFFPGIIDDVRIYNRALTAQEVQQLYLMGK
jgi:hypothetical protein